MCGIAGVHFKKLRAIEQKKIENITDLLLLGIESRGKDATGFVAVTNDGKHTVLDKQPVRASIFIQSRMELPKRPRSILLHTRWATQGWPTNPGNNHPVQYGDTFVTHNGHIDNDDQLFKNNDLKRFAEVDTEVIAAMIEKHGFDKINLALKELDGGFAIAAINPLKNPNELILAKGETSPLYIYENDDFVMWCSERMPIEKTCKEILDFKPEYEDVKYVEKGVMAWVKGSELEVYKFPTYDEAHPKPKRWEHRSGYANQQRTIEAPKKRTENKGLLCKGCDHRLAMHPSRTGTEDQTRCTGSSKCHCRKYVSRNRTDKKADPMDIVAYLGVTKDGDKFRCAVNRDGDLINMVTGEMMDWEGVETLLDEEKCVCEHNQFWHVGMINNCNYAGCKCIMFVEVKESEFCTAGCEVVEGESLDNVEVQCDGCQIWMNETFLNTCDGALLCNPCQVEWHTAARDTEEEEAPDEKEQWMDLAMGEEELHGYCLTATAGATGFTTEFIDWLLFRCPPELMQKEQFLINARELCDEGYGNAEDEYYHGKQLERHASCEVART